METLHFQNLTHLRKTKRLSQKELAHKAGIVRTTLSRIESGRIRPSLAEVRWIAQALGVPEAEVLAVLERSSTVLWTPQSERPSRLSQLLRAKRERALRTPGHSASETRQTMGR